MCVYEFYENEEKYVITISSSLVEYATHTLRGRRITKTSQTSRDQQQGLRIKG